MSPIKIVLRLPYLKTKTLTKQPARAVIEGTEAVKTKIILITDTHLSI